MQKAHVFVVSASTYFVHVYCAEILPGIRGLEMYKTAHAERTRQLVEAPRRTEFQHYACSVTAVGNADRGPLWSFILCGVLKSIIQIKAPPEGQQRAANVTMIPKFLYWGQAGKVEWDLCNPNPKALGIQI